MKMLIAGEQVDSESGQTTEVRNPATGEIVDSVPKGTVNDIRRAIDAAQGALKKWSHMAPSKRGAVLLAAGHTILQQEKELATLLTKEQGKPMRESILEIRRFVHTLDHYGGMAKTMRTSAVLLDTGRHGLVLRKPLGVCGSIVPWNFPVSLMGNKLGPALLAGNCVVVKPAGTTPLTDLRTCEIIDKAIQDAGGPKGVLNVVTGPGSVVGEELLVNPTVQKNRLHRRHRYRPQSHAIRRQGFQARDFGIGRQRSDDRLRRRRYRSRRQRCFRGPVF